MQVPIVFITGYDSPAIEEEWRAFPKLAKPFSVGDLECALIAAQTRAQHPPPLKRPFGIWTGDPRADWSTACAGRNVFTEVLIRNGKMAG